MTTVTRLTTMLAAAAAALTLIHGPAFAAADHPADTPEAAEQVAAADTGTDAAPEPAVSAEWAGPFDWAALDWHPDPTFALSPHHLSLPGLSEASATTWNRTENADGSTAVTVKHALTQGWDSKIGADISLAPPPPDAGPINPASLLPGAGTDPSAGAAWATLAPPADDAPIGLDGTALGARLDASQTQHKLGVSASKSLHLGEQLSLTLQGGYAATDLAQTGSVVPVPPSGLDSARVYTTEQAAKLVILPTHTTIAAGRTLSSSDTRWLHTVTAEQQLFTGVSLAGSISEASDGPPATSIVAKFQHRW